LEIILNQVPCIIDLERLFKEARLGNRTREQIESAFSNSKYVVSVKSGKKLLGVGRGFGDEVDCAVICDLAVGFEVLKRLFQRYFLFW